MDTKRKPANGMDPSFDPGYSDELVSKNDVLRVLHGVGGTDASPGTWSAGWDEAINNAYDLVEKLPPEVPEDFTGKNDPKGLKAAHVLRRLVYAIRQHVWEDMTPEFGLEVERAEKAIRECSR